MPEQQVGFKTQPGNKSFKAGLVYVLRYMWFWLPALWLRPFDVLERGERVGTRWSVLVSAMASGTLWGGIAGIILWLVTGEIYAIVILASITAIAVLVAIEGLAADLGAVKGIFANTLTLAFISAVAVVTVAAVIVIAPNRTLDTPYHVEVFAFAFASVVAAAFAIAGAIMDARTKAIAVTVAAVFVSTFAFAFITEFVELALGPLHESSDAGIVAFIGTGAIASAVVAAVIIAGTVSDSGANLRTVASYAAIAFALGAALTFIVVSTLVSGFSNSSFVFGASVFIAFAIAFIISAAVASAIAVTVAIKVASTATNPMTIIYLSVMAAIGILIQIWLSSFMNSLIIMFIGIVIFLFFILVFLDKLNWIKIPLYQDWSSIPATLIRLVGLPIIIFALLSRSVLPEVPIWYLSFISVLALGVLAETIGIIKHKKLILASYQINWLWNIWGLFFSLALIAWLAGLLNPEIQGLDIKFDKLAIFLILTPIILSGLPFWPVNALIALWQFNSRRINHHDLSKFSKTLPFRWQLFAYPLPALSHYLSLVYPKYGPKIAFETIQHTQSHTLQMMATRRVLNNLTSDSETAIPFCGEVAIATNNATLIPFSYNSLAARALSGLTKKQRKESRQPIQLAQSHASIQAKLTAELDWVKEFESIRKQALDKRLEYTFEVLGQCSNYRGVTEFRELIQALFYLVKIDHLQDIQKRPLQPKSTVPSDMQWLLGGWQVLADIKDVLSKDLATYPEFNDFVNRHQFLHDKTEQLRSLAWDDLPAYWGNIGQELVEHWVTLLQDEAQQVLDDLALQVELVSDQIGTGQQILQFQVNNPGQLLARDICVNVEATAGIRWQYLEVTKRVIGVEESLFNFELGAEQEGHYEIEGKLIVEDVYGNLFEQGFTLPLTVAASAERYQVPEFTPYIVFESIGNDDYFFGRSELLAWLQQLWRQPEDKPAVALVGQHRIGKTSILNKIQRDGLAGTNLLPVLVKIQGVNSDYDFLNDAARQISEILTIDRPKLDRFEPYADFKDFLLDTKNHLNNHRFLFMLDDADLIPERHLGELLPGFLRSLMQEPQYPTLVLFCGTHALRHMAQEYASILFNTAQFHTVSYMTEAESFDLLSKPAENILQFEPATLKEAYRMTAGQPLLLQSLGDTLINQFNAVLSSGNERSNQVTLADLDQAANALIQQQPGNLAFENHWNDNDTATHWLMSILAWLTREETEHHQLDLGAIEAVLHDSGVELPEGTASTIVERLVEEEILLQDGTAYRFAVPLYQRWIVYHWPPQ